MYEPFVIADASSGVIDGKKPWISPSDAFRRLENARVFRGRVMKRLGWQHFATLGTLVEDENLGTLVGGEFLIGYNPAPPDPDFSTFVVNNLAQIANLPILPPNADLSYYAVEIVTNPWTFRIVSEADPGVPLHIMDKVAGPPLQPGSLAIIDMATGRWLILLAGGDTFLAGDVTITYEYNRGLAVTSITEFIDSAGVQQLVATDTRRLWLYNPTTAHFEDQTVADVWTGDAEDLMQVTPYRDTLVLNNNVDPPQLFDPVGGLRAQDTDLTVPGGPGQDIERCWQTVAFKNRLVIFRPTESGSELIRSLRWMRVNQLETLDADDVTEIPTDARFVHARVIGDRCIIFCDRPGECFELVPEDEALAPWSFRRLRGEGDASSRLGGVNLLDEALIWGNGRLLRCDGTETLRVYQDETPDVVQDSNPLASGLVVGVDADVLEEVWLAYSPSEESIPSRTIAVNARTRAIMFYNHEVSAFGRYRATAGSAYTWATAPGRWIDAFFAWNSGALRAGFPLVLVGDRHSRVFNATAPQFGDDVFESYENPVETEFEMLMETNALNPYARPGGSGLRSARLGMIDLVLEPVDGGTLTVEVRSSWKNDPVLTQEIDLTPDTPGDLNVFRRVMVNRTAEGHIITLRDSSAGPRIVEAIIPHFAPSAPIRRVA